MNHLPITTVFCPWLLLGFYSFFSCMTYGVNATSGATCHFHDVSDYIFSDHTPYLITNLDVLWYDIFNTQKPDHISVIRASFCNQRNGNNR